MVNDKLPHMFSVQNTPEAKRILKKLGFIFYRNDVNPNGSIHYTYPFLDIKQKLGSYETFHVFQGSSSMYKEIYIGELRKLATNKSGAISFAIKMQEI